MDISGVWVDANPGAAHSFPMSEGRLLKFVRLDQPSSVYFGARGGTTFGNQLVGVPPFSLGGANAFAAYGQNELLTDQYYQFQARIPSQGGQDPGSAGRGTLFQRRVRGGQGLRAAIPVTNSRRCRCRTHGQYDIWTD